MSAFEDAVIQRIRSLEREVERLQRWERPTGGGGVTDHGDLTGLADDDHPQYLLRTDKAADSDKLDGVHLAAFLGLNDLADPNADRVLFWDDSAGTLKWLTVSTGLALSDTSLALSHLGLQSLTDPDADRVLFWDDSAGALKWLTVEGIVDTDLGKWQSWTPSVTSASGTITSYSASGYYCKIGKVVYCTMSISITDNGTGSGAIITSVPVSVSGFAVGAGRDNAKSGAMLQLYATGTEIRIFDYKNYYPAVTDSVLYCSINYAAA